MTRLGTPCDRWFLFPGAAAGMGALILAAANLIQQAGYATVLSLAFFAIFGLTRAYRRFGRGFRIALARLNRSDL
jgi:hypothetical protein